MRMINIVIEQLMALIECTINYSMTHVKLVLLVFFGSIIVLCFIDFKTRNSVAFGFWWNLTLMIDRVIKRMIIGCLIGIAMESIVLCYMFFQIP